MIPEAQHLDALFGEEQVAFLVSGTPVRETVSAAVEFDRQLRERAVEVKVVNAASVLASEFEFSKAAVTKQSPEPLLSVRSLLAELTGEVAGAGSAGAVFAILWWFPALSPLLNPLPRWGEEEILWRV